MGKNVFILGSGGALGRAIVAKFQQRSWNVIGADVSSSNNICEHFITLNSSDNLLQQYTCVSHSCLPMLDAIVNVSGGFAMGPAGSKAYLEDAQRMISSSVMTTVLTAQTAADFLKDNGLVITTGANAALGQNGTSFAAPYAASKAFVHQFTQSMHYDPKGCGLPANARVTSMVPVTLDTPMNRRDMPDADTSSWTPLDDIANWVADVAEGTEKMNAPLVKIVTSNNKTRFEEISG